MLRGQASHGIRGRKLRSAEQVAFERVEQRHVEQALANRLPALLPASSAEPPPF